MSRRRSSSKRPGAIPLARRVVEQPAHLDHRRSEQVGVGEHVASAAGRCEPKLAEEDLGGADRGDLLEQGGKNDEDQHEGDHLLTDPLLQLLPELRRRVFLLLLNHQAAAVLLVLPLYVREEELEDAQDAQELQQPPDLRPRASRAAGARDAGHGHRLALHAPHVEQRQKVGDERRRRGSVEHEKERKQVPVLRPRAEQKAR